LQVVKSRRKVRTLVITDGVLSDKTCAVKQSADRGPEAGASPGGWYARVCL